MPGGEEEPPGQQVRAKKRLLALAERRERLRTEQVKVRGEPERQIAITLNDERVPTLTGTSWYATTVAGMLRNPLYKGWVTHNGESYPAVGPDGQTTHEPIIDAETWERAKQHRKALSDSPGRGRGRRTHGSHLFTGGLLRCSCGAPMSPVTKPTRTPGKLYEVYTCAHRLHHGAGARPRSLV
jgi:Recombinase